MTIEEIIAKWEKEKNRVIDEMQFCKRNNFNQERACFFQRYNAISEILCDLKYDLDYLDSEE